MKDIKKIIAIICLVLGLAFVGFGGYKIVTFDSSDEEEKKENDKKEEDKKEENLEEVKSEIQAYLKDKYNEDFEVVKLAKSFCLEDYGTNLAYSEPCTDKKIKNEIYEVKNDRDLTFYVKKVSYDTTKITLTRENDINMQSVGLYDNYISFIVADKLENELESLYSSFFGKNVTVDVFNGLGIHNIHFSNAYEYLGKDMQIFTDKEISLNDFVANIDNSSNNLSILIKVNQDLTKDNFQSIVSVIKNNEFIPSNYLIEFNEMLIQFNNGNRYIEYNGMFDYILLKYGKDIFDFTNDKLYDKSILLGNGGSSNGISYDEFMALDPSTFNF